ALADQRETQYTGENPFEEDDMTRSWRSGALGTIVVLLAMVSAAPASFAAPDAAPAQAPAAQGTKRIIGVVASSPTTLSGPIAATAGSSRGQDALIMLVNSGLTMIDNTARVLPVLAESVPSVENGLWVVYDDGRMDVTFRIRPGARWHDGVPVTAGDFVFADQLRGDRELAVFGFSSFAPLEAVVAVDPATVRMNWSRPYIYADLAYGFQGQTSPLPLPRHILERPYLDDKLRFPDHPYFTTQFVGSGPFKVRDYSLDSHVLLDANDAYVLGRPKVDQFEVRFIPDANTTTANLLAGAIDVTLGGSFALETGVEINRIAPNAKIALASRGAVTAFPQFLNPSPPLLLNLDFRRALAHAADRETMVETLMFNQTAVAHSFVNPVETVYRDVESSIVRYEYNPLRTTQFVEGLGYRRGSEGLYRDPSGQTINMQLAVQGGRGDPRGAATLALVDNWRQAGLDAEVFIISPALAVDEEVRAQFPGFDMVRRGNYRFDLYRVLASIEAPLPENRFRGGNRGRYMNADLDALIETHDATIDERQRGPMLAQIVHHVTDQVVMIGLFFDLDATVYSDRIVGSVTGFAERSTQAWNAHTWDVR
ncbi:MAG: hypothetical protein HW416_3073, partial [Chloroflexi bacterium]|nr:hypothetical protein [Chloroflexota bacterium]